MGMVVYLAGRPPAIDEVVLGRGMLRGEGDLSCMSASCICGSGEEQILLLHGVVCPDDSGDRWSKGSLPDTRIVPRKSMISTTSYNHKEEDTKPCMLLNNVPLWRCVLARNKHARAHYMQYCATSHKHKVFCNLTNLRYLRCCSCLRLQAWKALRPPKPLARRWG